MALGGLVAVGTKWLLEVPARIGAAMSWVGLGAIIVSAVVFNSQTAYPGSLVAVPVVGAALIIAGGATASRLGAESVLGLAPCGWLGNLSYSLYLWHWPILIIAAEYQGKTALTFRQSVPWLALALGASIITYLVVENPIRHARFVSRRRWTSVALGVSLILVTVVVATVTLDGQSQAAELRPNETVKAGSDPEIAKLVAASDQIHRLPGNLTPSLQDAANDWGAPRGPCQPVVGQITVPKCVFGDPTGIHTMVLYGDSHALMWFQVMNEIAVAAHWRLVILGKGYCMANKYPSGNALGQNVILHKCSRWQQFAYHRIKELDPDLVIISQEDQNGPGGKPYTAAQWRRGLEETITYLSSPRTKFIVLGNIPNLGFSPPDCLSEHPDQVQSCSAPSRTMTQGHNRVEQRAVTAKGGRYIDVARWFCSTRCSSIIGHYEVYLNRLHVTETYSLFLRQALAQKLELSKY